MENKIGDYYLNQFNVVKRLIKEHKQHGRLIVAYDFDNTVYDYHNEGHSYDKVIELIRECRKLGCYLIVFTASHPNNYENIKTYLGLNDIPYHGINQNMPGLPFENHGKIYYNILLDDRAGLQSAYEALLSAVTHIKIENEQQRNQEETKND